MSSWREESKEKKSNARWTDGNEIIGGSSCNDLIYTTNVELRHEIMLGLFEYS